MSLRPVNPVDIFSILGWVGGCGGWRGCRRMLGGGWVGAPACQRPPACWPACLQPSASPHNPSARAGCTPASDPRPSPQCPAWRVRWLACPPACRLRCCCPLPVRPRPPRMAAPAHMCLRRCTRPHTAPSALAPATAGVGTVAENGPGASKFAVGQRVVGTPFDTVVDGSGTWQQYMAVSEACLAPVPDAVTDDAAAQCECGAAQCESGRKWPRSALCPLPAPAPCPAPSPNAQSSLTPVPRMAWLWRPCKSPPASGCCRPPPGRCWGARSFRCRPGGGCGRGHEGSLQRREARQRLMPCRRLCPRTSHSSAAPVPPPGLQLCKHRGIKTINVVRRQEQVAELKELG